MEKQTDVIHYGGKLQLPVSSGTNIHTKLFTLPPVFSLTRDPALQLSFAQQKEEAILKNFLRSNSGKM